MANTRLPAQTQQFSLAGSGIASGATTIILKSFKKIDGTTNITMANLGTKAYMTLEPNNGTQEEQISFTAVTQNSDGTATLTGVTRSLDTVSPYTSTGSGVAHTGGSTAVLSNTAAFYSEYANTLNDNTFTGANTFSQVVTGVTPTLSTHLATKGYADALAIAGVPDASTTVKGIVEVATQAEVDARTTTGGTSAFLIAPLNTARSTLASDYAADTGAANAYVITPTPAITAYTVGQTFNFKAVNTNTTTSTLNVSGLGAITIKKVDGATNLVSGDIKAGQVVEVEYDGTNFQIQSPVGNAPLTTQAFKFGGTGSDGALNVSSGTTVIALGSVRFFEKNYTTISITGTGKISFSGAHASGTFVTLRATGDVTLTSSQTPMIDGSGIGATGGTSPTFAGVTGTGYSTFLVVPSAGGGSANSTVFGSTATGGAGGVSGGLVSITPSGALTMRTILVAAGAGGGGAVVSGAFTPGGASGGTGGGALYIECGGAWNFTTASGISVAGTAGGTSVNGGGAGGGAGGTFLALYNTLTANTGTVSVSGGAGGTAGSGAAGGAGGNGSSGTGVGGAGGNGNTTGGWTSSGAGGGASFWLTAAGSAGTAGTLYGGGGGGASGLSVVVANTYFN